MEKINTEEIYTLKSLLGRTLFNYIYEEEDVEDIHINSFEGDAVIKYAGGLKKAVQISLEWDVIFYYLSTFKGTKYKENEKLLIELPGNHRFIGIMGHSLANKVSITIRVFKPSSKATFRSFEVNKHMEKFFKKAIIDKKTIFISGATGSGKTTFLNLLIRQVPLKERIIAIDDTKELKIPHKDKVETFHNDYEQILDFVLKSRPDRVLLGELTTKNAPAVEKFITNGHKGFMMTMHANSPKQAISETFFAKFSSEQKAVNNQEKLEALLRNNIDIIIQLHQQGGGLRKITDIYFVKENKNYSLPDDYLLFEKEHLSSFLVHKNRTNLKKEIDLLLEKQSFVTVQDIVSKVKINYKTAHKLIPQNILRKNVVKEKVKNLINQSPSVIYKELQRDGLDISKRHIRRVKKACLLFKEQINEAR